MLLFVWRSLSFACRHFDVVVVTVSVVVFVFVVVVEGRARIHDDVQPRHNALTLVRTTERKRERKEKRRPRE